MYFIDSLAFAVYAMDFDAEAGTISNRRVAVDYKTEPALAACSICFVPSRDLLQVPDGMCIDEDDKIWVASFFGSRVRSINIRARASSRCQVTRWDPATGQKLQTIMFPANRYGACPLLRILIIRPSITSCAFAGEHLDELWVTSAGGGMTPEQRESTPDAGSVFKVTGLGVRGAPPVAYSPSA
jgi:sugar lactone lactonase YvrE